MEATSADLIERIVELTYFTRGSIPYEYMLKHMSIAELEIVDRFIAERLDDERSKPVPNY